MHIAYAMRFVMEALKKEQGSKMYYFGLAALDQFKGRLKDYPRYSLCIAQMPHFPTLPKHLQEVKRLVALFLVMVVSGFVLSM